MVDGVVGGIIAEIRLASDGGHSEAVVLLLRRRHHNNYSAAATVSPTSSLTSSSNIRRASTPRLDRVSRSVFRNTVRHDGHGEDGQRGDVEGRSGSE